MAAVTKNFVLNGAHTAGIFADMSADGPEIGTLVCIVDRAKNLPNRKTIGKQDPYCAARLGKEARKTATDIRGGQTPKWDQELRFTVHDSADYYQLKISIFTDDKKTDLIGEGWIDLKSIIIPGGGQSDMWQTLNCRGKYAGEIRLEITYYDVRPKPDNNNIRAMVKPKQLTGLEMEAGAVVKRKDPTKRRPLPTDPVTGETTAILADHPAPTRHKPVSHSPRTSSQSLEGTGSRHGYSPSPGPDQTLPPRVNGPRVEGPRELRKSTPRRESYDTAPPRQPEERDYSQKIIVQPFEQPDARGDYEMTPADNYMAQGQLQHQPPPPPVHRPRNSQEALRRENADTSPQRAIAAASMRQDVLKNEISRNSTPSYPGRPKFRGGYDTQQSPMPMPPQQKALTYEPHSASRQNSYDAYDPHHRSMQPTVEDYPESEAGSSSAYNNHRRTSARMPQPEEVVYENPSMSSTNLSRSPGASPGYMGHSPRRTSPPYDGHESYQPAVVPASSREFSTSPGHGSFHTHSGQGQRSNARNEHEPSYVRRSSGYGLPNLPSSSTVDLASTRDVNHRMYDDRRHENPYAMTTTRNRHQSEPPMYDVRPGTAPHGYAPPSYDSHRGPEYGNPQQDTQIMRRNVSPNPNMTHTIRRKSVSPAPLASDQRRTSDIPFSPDSYDTYNPSVSRGNTPGMDPEPTKFVTHDGREIDPSDHLPVETWAPEPESKPGPVQETRTRPVLTGAQPMPPSSRRQLRVRAQSSAAATHSYDYQQDTRSTPPTSNPPPRGRLQKKQRMSTGGGGVLPSGGHSFPADNYQDRQAQYGHNRVPRAGAWDYHNENQPPNYHGGSGPPIPAKVPLPIMSGANGGGEMALIQEMQKIDIGTGRSRRRGGY